MPTSTSARDDFVAMVRLRYVLGSLGAVHHGCEPMELQGDARAGHFVEHDGCGNHIAIFWDERGVVALAFDHESHESEYNRSRSERRPQRFLRDAPPELAELVGKASNYGERLATDGSWAFGSELRGFESDESSLFQGYDSTPKAAMTQWRQESSVSAKHGALALAIAEKSAARPYTMTDEDAAIALKPPSAKSEPVKLENLEQAVALLEKAGITWPGVVERARAEQARLDKERDDALGPSAALLRAAQAGDVDAAFAALAAGADIDAAAPEGYLHRVVQGSTPLLIALWRSHFDLAARLIDAGADVNLCSPGDHHPLGRAAASGKPDLCRKLLARGAELGPRKGARDVFECIANAWSMGPPEPPNGSVEDYVELIRFFMDKNLSTERSAAALSMILLTAGESELEPRVWPPFKVPVVLPTVPDGPIVDAADAHAKLPALLAQAIEQCESGAQVSALYVLEDAWRLTRDPRIGDIVDVPLQPDLWYPPRNQRRSTDMAARMRMMAESPAEPRWAREVMFWLSHHGPGTFEEAERAVDVAAAALIATRDVRVTKALARFCGRERQHGRLPRPSLLVALRALEAFQPVELTDEELGQVAVLEDLFASHPPARGKPSIRSLFRAVYDAPKDDEIRRELAARLEAAGDPRGAFIRLQLARAGTDAEPSEEERALLAEHGRGWLGQIGGRVAGDTVFRKGFLWRASTGSPRMPFEEPMAFGPVAMGLGLEEEWSTVERLSLWRQVQYGTQGMLACPRLQGLLELADLPREDLTILAAGPTRPLEILEIGWPRHSQYWSRTDYEPLLAKTFDWVPALREARFSARALSVERVQRLIANLKQLRRLSVGVAQGGAFSEWVQLARTTKLETMTVLSAYDLAMELSTGTLELRFIRLDDDLVKLAAADVGSLVAERPTRLVLRIRANTTVEHDAQASSPPALTIDGTRVSLAPIWEAAGALGATCSLEPEQVHWSRSPERDS